MPSLDERNTHPNRSSFNGDSLARPSFHWNGYASTSNGNRNGNFSQQRGHYFQANGASSVSVVGNGGPLTTVLAPPKEPCLINLDRKLETTFFQYPLLP
ncbi:unnamed protein product, partial [Allacma fusca]